MFVFYHPDISGNEVILNSEESHHLARVLRLRKDDSVNLVNGKGNIFKGIVKVLNPKSVVISNISLTSTIKPKPYQLHLAIAPTKMTERFEWFLEKSTEIGIDRITPLHTHRGERFRLNETRMKKILISAMKQSLSGWLPVLETPATVKELIASKTKENILIAHCLEGSPKSFLSNCIGNSSEILVMIGPEGDFTPDEIKLSIEVGAKEISLGKARLRTETAGIFACSLVAGYYYSKI